MTIFVSQDPTSNLESKISEVANKQKTALLVIDNGPKDPPTAEELRIIKYCAGQKANLVQIWLFCAPFSSNEAQEILLTEPEAREKYIHKDVVKAAGRKALIRPKQGPSALKDHIRSKEGPQLTLGKDFTKMLDFLGARSLIITGRYLHACIRATIMDALAADFEVITASTVLHGNTSSLKGESKDYFKFIEGPKVSWYSKGYASSELATYN